MYESPIEKVVGEIQSQIIKQDDENIMYAVKQAVGYSVDKNELIKALKYDREQYEKGYRDGLNADKWIPVSERLPYPWDERYLVSLAWGGIGIMEYKSTGFHNYGSFTPVPIESIIAWMPLPEPWKGERNEHLIDRQAVIDKDTNVPSKDSIDRQAVINAIANTCFWLSSDNWEELVKCIDSISPVNPQEPTEWQQDHEILKAYSDGANEMLDKIRSEIEGLAIVYDKSPDYKDTRTDGEKAADWWKMYKKLVLGIIDKYREG